MQQRISMTQMCIRDRFTDGQDGIEAGSFLIRSKRGLAANVTALSEELGLDFTGVSKKPSANFNELRKVKIGIYKSWQANMDEGWSRWMLEQFEFDLDTLHNEDVQAGDLSKYTAILFPDQDVYKRQIHKYLARFVDFGPGLVN